MSANIDDGLTVAVKVFFVCLDSCSCSRQQQQVAVTFRTRARSVIYMDDDHSGNNREASVIAQTLINEHTSQISVQILL